MKNSKLLELVGVFSYAEIKGFSNYLEREYLKKETTVVKLWGIVEKQYPFFAEKEVTREKIFKKIFPRQQYHENKLSKVMSELFKNLENYLIENNRYNNTLSETLILLKYYHSRNLDKFFESTCREFQHSMDELPEGMRKHFLKYDFEILKATYDFKHNNRKGSFQPIYNNLVDFSLTESYRWKNLAKSSTTHCLEEPMPSSLLYNVHTSLSTLLSEDNDSLFIEIIHTLSKEIAKIDQEESREILSILLDYSINRVNTGKSEFYQHLYTIYNLHIQKDLILQDDGKIFIAKYKNYITVALKLGKISEAESFLEKYKEYLPCQSKEETYHFNKANILFEKGNYDTILNLLNTIKFDDIFYTLNQKRLFIKTYYELLLEDNSYFDIFHSSMNAYKKFIYTENTVPDIYIDANKNFLKLVQKISGLSKNDKKKITQLSTELKSTQKLAEREWLLKKLEEISP